ncbi:glucosyltransferase MdoH, partial [Pseudomonas syringae pv. pisi str. 1704B]
TKLAIDAIGRLHERVWSEGHEEWLAAWRASIEADPHAP